MIQAWASSDRATGKRQRLERHEQRSPRRRTGRCGRPWSASTPRRARAGARASTAGARGRPPARGGRRAARQRPQPPAIGRRRITSSALERQLAHLLGVPRAGRDHREVARVELARGTPARRPRRRRGRRRVHSASVVWPVWSMRMSRTWGHATPGRSLRRRARLADAAS